MTTKFAWELTNTFDPAENQNFFRPATDGDGTRNYGADPDEVIVYKGNDYRYGIDAHMVADSYDFPDGVESAIAELSPFDKFDVWNTPEDRITDMMHPLHIMLLYKEWLFGDYHQEMESSIAYWGSFEAWIADEIYWRCNECELDIYDEDCTRYVTSVIKSYNRIMEGT